VHGLLCFLAGFLYPGHTCWVSFFTILGPGDSIFFYSDWIVARCDVHTVCSSDILAFISPMPSFISRSSALTA